MTSNRLTARLIERYMQILGVKLRIASPDLLNELIKAQMARVPFENISKLVYHKRMGLRGVIDFELYLDGVERDHFGGTCYTTNYYFFRLLERLGFDVRLCGADMSNPDVHLVSIVRIDGREYIVDVGYAAPFIMPLPRDLAEDYIIEHGDDRYVLKPRDEAGRSRLEMYRGGQPRHAYVAKPEPREIGQFAGVIANSFSPEATFMNAILLTKHWPGGSISIRNQSLIEVDRGITQVKQLAGRNELLRAIEEHFGIAPTIAEEAIGEIPALSDAWH